jgi:rhamnose transport system permease protein
MVRGWPVPVLVFLGVALLLGWVLHSTTLGRRVYLVGLNRDSARYAGININRVELFVFSLSGLLSGIAAIFLVSRSGVVVYNLASGYELTAITVVVVGGVSVYGGTGSILGSVIALALIATLQRGMSLASVSEPVQLIVIGTLLIGAIAATTIIKRIDAWRKTRSRVRPSSNVRSTVA